MNNDCFFGRLGYGNARVFEAGEEALKSLNDAVRSVDAY